MGKENGTMRMRNVNVASRSRARLRELKEAAALAAQIRQTSVLRISRTVEMIDQSDDKWRDERAKLMFVVALGLTPIQNKNGLLVPKVVLEVMKPEVAEKYLDKFRREQKAHKRKLQEARIKKFQQGTRNVFRSDPVVIDITSDNEESAETYEDAGPENPPYVPASEYPNLTISVVRPSPPAVSMCQNRNAIILQRSRPLQIQRRETMKAIPQNFSAEPKVILRV